MKKDETEVKESSQEENIEKFMGRDYDLSTAEGRAGLRAAHQTFETMFGKQAQNVGELRKEVEPYRKYDLKQPSQDDATIMERVENLRSEGKDDDAFKLLFEYNTQTRESLRSELQAEREFEALWTDYKSARPQIFDAFDSIDERVYKSHIKNEYFGKLGEADNQFELLDRVLGPKANRKAIKAEAPKEEKVENDDAGLINSKSSSESYRPKAADSKLPEVKDVFEKHMEDLGFKKSI